MALLLAIAPAGAQSWFSAAAGPSLARGSGSVVVPILGTCISCPTTYEKVSGADDGVFHVAFAVGGALSPTTVFRVEGAFNHNSSPQTPPGPSTCSGLRCDRTAKAEVDDAYMLGAGFDWLPMGERRLTPYVLGTLGLQLNRIQWSDDSTSTKPTQSTALLGTYVSAGAGARYVTPLAEFFVEARAFVTSGTPGSAMTTVSAGALLRRKKR